MREQRDSAADVTSPGLRFERKGESQREDALDPPFEYCRESDKLNGRDEGHCLGPCNLLLLLLRFIPASSFS